MTVTRSQHQAGGNGATHHHGEMESAAAEAGIAVGDASLSAEETQARRARFAAGLRQLRVGGGLNLDERVLMIAGGIIAPVGIIVVLLGWYGAARNPNTYEQIPYLISGGLLGVALVFLGAFFYFTHWLTQLVKEQRSQSSAVLDALGRLHDELGSAVSAVAAPAAGDGVTADEPTVATARGTLAHRASCSVVAGKDDLRLVSDDEDLAPCRLCQPF